MLALTTVGGGSVGVSSSGSLPIGWLGSSPHLPGAAAPGSAATFGRISAGLKMTAAASFPSTAAVATGESSSSSESHQQYLASSERLLRLLKVIPSSSAGGGDDSSPAITTPIVTEETTTMTSDDEDQDHQGQDDKEAKTADEEEDNIEEQTDDDDAESNAFYKTLERTENLATLILVALDDIRCWRDRSISSSNQNNNNNNDNKAEGPSTSRTDRRANRAAQVQWRKTEALERQRELLLQQKQRQQEQMQDKMEEEEEDCEAPRLIQNIESNDEELEVDNNEEQDDYDAEQVAMEDNSEGDEDGNDEQIPDSSPSLSWQIVQRTFRSLQVLTPILLHMLRHGSRYDADVTIDKLHIRTTKRRKQARTWLFGEHVYDVCIRAQEQRVMERLSQIYLMLGLGTTVFYGADGDEDATTTSTEQLIHICQTTLDATIRQARALHEADSSSSSCFANDVCPLPFDGLDQADQLYTKSHALDDQYELTKPLNENAKDYEQYQVSIRNLQTNIYRLLARKFPDCRLSVYGSCLSDLSLGKNADVDLSLTIPEMVENKHQFEAGEMSAANYQNAVKKKVFLVCNLLERRGDFINMQPVHRARVPVIKGRYTSAQNPYDVVAGALDFDICFLNDIAVANSGLLREYSLVDVRIKHLMIAVKRWAKANGLSSAQDAFLSSYAWMNLVVFYVLNLGLAPNLQSEALAEQVVKDYGNNKGKNEWHCVNNLDTFYLKWTEVRSASVWEMPDRLTGLSVTALLYGFFRFYAEDFRGAIAMISIKRFANGAPPLAKWKGFRRLTMFMSIEDPFETYNSHMPHDLGNHASDAATLVIMERFHAGKEHLLRNLTMAERSNEAHLWPIVEPQSLQSDRKGKNSNAQQRGRNWRQQQNTQSNGRARDQTGGGRNPQNGTNNRNRVNQANSRSTPNPKTKPPPAGDQATTLEAGRRLQSKQKGRNNDPNEPSQQQRNNDRNRRRNQGRRQAESQDGGSAGVVAGTATAKTTSASIIDASVSASTKQLDASKNASARNARPRNPRSNEGAKGNRDQNGGAMRLNASANGDDGAASSNVSGNEGAKTQNNNRRRNPRNNRRGKPGPAEAGASHPAGTERMAANAAFTNE